MYQAEEECTFFNTPCLGTISMFKVIQKAIVKRWHWNIQNELLLLESWIISSFLSLCASEPQKVEVKQDEDEELWWKGIPYTLQNPFTINQSVNVFFFSHFPEWEFHRTCKFSFSFALAKVWICGVISSRHVLGNRLVSWTLHGYL